MFSKLTVICLSLFLTLAACSVSEPSQLEPPSEGERSSALAYAREVPFVLGALPMVYSGATDPLARFAEHPGYTAHMVLVDGVISSGEQGVEVGRNDVRGLVVLFKPGPDRDSLVAAATNEGCGENQRCRSSVEQIEVPYSLVELRSITGWVARSPLRFVSTQTPIVERDGKFSSHARLTVDETRIQVLEEMLLLSGAPTDAWEVAPSRYVTAN